MYREILLFTWHISSPYTSDTLETYYVHSTKLHVMLLDHWSPWGSKGTKHASYIKSYSGKWYVLISKLNFNNFIRDPTTRLKHINGILPKGPYLPCLRLADRALLAGYHRHGVCYPWFCEMAVIYHTFTRGSCVIEKLTYLIPVFLCTQGEKQWTWGNTWPNMGRCEQPRTKITVPHLNSFIFYITHSAALQIQLIWNSVSRNNNRITNKNNNKININEGLRIGSETELFVIWNRISNIC